MARPAVLTVADTIAKSFLLAAETRGDRPAIREKKFGIWQPTSWRQWLHISKDIAFALHAIGFKPGDVASIIANAVPEWVYADMGILCAGGVSSGIYPTDSAAQVEYLVNDSATRVIFAEDEEQLDKILSCRARCPTLQKIIVFDMEGLSGFNDPMVLSLAEFMALGQNHEQGGEALWEAMVSSRGADDLAILVYTSGTTGPPKGVMLSHHAIMVSAHAIEEIIPLEVGGRLISWLPAAHIAERMAHHYIPVIYAGSITCCPNPREVVSFLPQVRPTWFFAVPRIWEKLKAGLDTMLAAQPEEQRAPMEAALSASIERVRLMQCGEPVPPELEETWAKADEQMFSHLRAMLGLDQAIAVNAGAAPTPVEVLEFFHAVGIELAELWGMSETCGFGTCNRPGAVKIGTVGPPSPGVELTLGDDGEVLVRGEFLMLGYRNAPEKTAEAVDAEGWLHTGDIGEIDEDGYLKIVDRKKEIIINAAGKNMSPANIEAAIKTSTPLIGQAVTIGDRRPYNTALIVLDADFAPQWAAQQGLEGKSLDELASEPAMVEAVQAGVDAANEKLARVEQIKKFTIVEGDWAPGGDELTPTMKLKRRPIAQKYEAEIAAMYSG
jgi:long-chain acyl-CoA synthetase